MRRISVLLVSLSLVGPFACGSDGTGPDDDAKVASLSFGLDTLSIFEGETAQLTVRALDASGAELAMQPTLTVEADGSSPLTLMSGARVRADGAGEATIRATAGQVSATLPVLSFGQPSGNSVESKPLAGRPFGAAVARNFAYVTQLDAGTVTRFSLVPFNASGVVQVGFVPTGISLNRNGSAALVTNQHDPSVGLIDASSNTQTTVFQTSSNSFRTIFNSGGTRGYATINGGQMLVINIQDRRVVATVPIVSVGNGLAFGANETELYVASTSGNISAVNTETHAVRNISLSGMLQDVAVSRDGKELYVAREDAGIIEVLSLPTGNKIASIAVPAPVFGLSITPGGRHLWAAHTGTGFISIIDRQTRSVVKSVFVGGAPRRIAFNRVGSMAVVSNEGNAVHLIR